MPDLQAVSSVARSPLTSPLGTARAARTGPIAQPEPRKLAADRNKVAATENPLAQAPRGVDLTAIARSAGQLGQALQNATDLVDAGASTADAVAYAPEAIQEAFARLGKIPVDASEKLAKAVNRATQAGRVLGAVGAAIAAKDLADSIWPKLDRARAGEALSNLALGLATVSDELFAAAGTNAVIKSIGGVAGAASSLFYFAREFKDAQEHGLGFDNAAGMIAAGVTAAGSIMLLMPGMQTVGGALIMGGASLNLVKLAHENWDEIKDRALAIGGPSTPAPAPARPALEAAASAPRPTRTRPARTGPIALPEPRMTARRKAVSPRDPLDVAPRLVDMNALALTASRLGEALQTDTGRADAGANQALGV